MLIFSVLRLPKLERCVPTKLFLDWDQEHRKHQEHQDNETDSKRDMDHVAIDAYRDIFKVSRASGLVQ